MLQIKDLDEEEARDLLGTVNYGHLGCAKDDQPYVVPMHYAFDGANVYFLRLPG